MPISAVQSFSNCINPEIGCYFAKSGKTWAVHILGHWCIRTFADNISPAALSSLHPYHHKMSQKNNALKPNLLGIFWCRKLLSNWTSLKDCNISPERSGHFYTLRHINWGPWKLTVFGNVWGTGPSISYLFSILWPCYLVLRLFKV